jgi:short-subunit dehydrogenase
MSQLKTIIITGASSGLGKALAIAYADVHTHLFLTARNESRLQSVASICRQKGAIVNIQSIDIRDARLVRDWLSTIGKIDLLIANAGISAGTALGFESEEQTREIFATNLDGVLNTVLPVLPAMIAAKSGQIAIISSLAGMRGLPGCPAYSASKAAVKAYGEALRGSLKSCSVKVTVVLPGYIKTPLTEVNKFPMPFLMEAEKAANIIKTSLCSDPSLITFPWLLYFSTWLLKVLPVRISDYIAENLPPKE